MDIFRLTSRPDISNFFKTKDPKDLRLGSLVKSNPLNYNEARFVLLGCPDDTGIRLHEGLEGSDAAPDAIREVLYQLAYPKELEKHGFFDLGNVIVEDDLEKTHNKVYEIVKDVISDDKILILLGGGLDLNVPTGKALHEVKGELVVGNVSNRYNVVQSEIPHHETAFFQLINSKILKPTNLVSIGIQPAANSYHYHQYLKDEGSRFVYQRDIANHGLKTLLDDIPILHGDHPVLWSYDMNVVKTSDAPGVSTITSTGITSEDVVELARYSGKRSNSQILEILEINPSMDINARTARLASLIIIHFVARNVL